MLETKSFHASLKITDDGEFLRWNDYRKTYEGMPSPIAQNERHVRVLKDLLKRLPMPTRLGLRLEPTVIPLVLVSLNARIDRPSPRSFDTSCVIKADVLEKTVMRDIDEKSTLGVLASAAKIVNSGTLEELARIIAAEHKPAAFDYAARSSSRTRPKRARQGQPPEVDIYFSPALGTAPSTWFGRIKGGRVMRGDGVPALAEFASAARRPLRACVSHSSQIVGYPHAFCGHTPMLKSL